MKKLIVFLAALVSLLGLVEVEAVPNHTLSEFKISKHLAGPEVDLNKVKGKVVVLDYWGTRCGPCIALLPHIARLDKRYARKGLVMIAAESQNSDEQAIMDLVKENRMECTVTGMVQGPKLANGLPHMAIFDVDGKLVFSGRPGKEADRVIKNELKRVDQASLGGEDSEDDDSSSGDLVEMREWTNKDGRTLKARLVSLRGTTGNFVDSRGKKFTYDVTLLSDDDQALIEKANTDL